MYNLLTNGPTTYVHSNYFKLQFEVGVSFFSTYFCMVSLLYIQYVFGNCSVMEGELVLFVFM